MDASHGRWVCIALLGTLLSACGGGDNNTTSSAGSAGGTSTAASTTNSNTTSPPSADVTTPETVSDSLDPSILSGSGAWWQPASKISSGNAGISDAPKWHVDNHGNVLAVWRQSDGTRDNLWASHYSQGAASWPSGSAQLLENQDFDIGGFDVAFRDDGRAVAVWMQSTEGTSFRLYAARFDGMSWSSPELVDIGQTGEAFLEGVTLDANGNALVTWLEHFGQTNNELWVNRYTSAGWGTPIRIVDASGGYRGPQRLEANDAGSALLLWEQSGDLWASYFAPTTGWSTASKISVEALQLLPSNTQIKLDVSGNAYVVWQSSDGTHSSVWANRYAVGTAWDTATRLDGDSSSNASAPQLNIANNTALLLWVHGQGSTARFGASQYASNGWTTAALSPSMGDGVFSKFEFDGNGNAMAVWLLYDANHVAHLWGKPYRAASGWGMAAGIDDPNSGEVVSSQLKFDQSGNAVAVWAQYDSTGAGTSLFANRYEPTIGWGVPAQISPAAFGSVSQAEDDQLAFDSQGNAMVIWYQSDNNSGNASLWANRYSNGNGWGTPTNIDSSDASANHATLQIDPLGNAFAIWTQGVFGSSDLWANRYTIQ